MALGVDSSAMVIPSNCIISGWFEKRQHSKLGNSKISAKRAVRVGVRFGAVTAKWERRWFYLLDSGFLFWSEAKNFQSDNMDSSCLILNANITSDKATIMDEIGDFDNTAHYLLIATATRRLVIRTDSEDECNNFITSLKKISNSKKHKDINVKHIVRDAEVMYALAPMYWNINNKGHGCMVINRASFKDLCHRHPVLGESLVVDVIFEGLIAEHSHAEGGLPYDRFLRYTKSLNSRSETNAAFDAIKFSLNLGPDEPLVRTEDLVQSTTPSLLLSNGTLFLTHRYLIHQAWNLDTINVIPLESIKSVGESTSSGLLSISDTLELQGVEVYQISVDVDNEDPFGSTEPYRDVRYQLQFSRFKDMILSSGEERDQGGRRGLWLDLLRELSHAYFISKTFKDSLSHPSAPFLPEFVALNLVVSRAIFRSSGHYSKSLLLCIAYSCENQAAQRILNSFFKRKPNETVEPMVDDIRENSEVFPVAFSANKDAGVVDMSLKPPSTPQLTPRVKNSFDEWIRVTLSLFVVLITFGFLLPKVPLTNSSGDVIPNVMVYRLNFSSVFFCVSLLYLLRLTDKRYLQP